MKPNLKPTLVALALFAATGAAVLYYPATRGVAETPPEFNPPMQGQHNQRPLIEVVFVLDTTGSMSGLIQAAKEKIWSIASSMAAARPTPEIRMGLVAYRDRGDTYVTRITDLSSDLDAMYATLMELQADGGGDTPEAVNQALHDAVHRIGWSTDPQAYRAIFLVGDAPPQRNYPNDVQYPITLAVAAERGIVVNTIQCGNYQATTAEWQAIASLGAGEYFQVDQAGSALAITTPFDERLAELSAALDRTRLYFGSDDVRTERERKLETADKLHAAASPESRARRAAFNASAGGERNFLGDGELVEEVSSGRVDLDELPGTELPEPMQTMAPAEREEFVAETARRRDELQRQVNELVEQRAGYLRDQVEALEDVETSLDYRIYSTVREQAASKGLHYEDAAPAY